MKKKTPATSTEGERNMTRRDRITWSMKFQDIEFPGLKFDKQGNIKRRLNVEVEPYNPELIFANDAFLKYLIIQLRKYLQERLNSEDGEYFCFGNKSLENRWIITEQFCEEMGIGLDFIQMLIDHLDCPDYCEGDFLNGFSVEDILATVHNHRKDDGDGDNKSNSLN